MVECRHRQEAIRLVVKKQTRNQGRMFWRCRYWFDPSVDCGYFEWCEKSAGHHDFEPVGCASLAERVATANGSCQPNNTSDESRCTAATVTSTTCNPVSPGVESQPVGTSDVLSCSVKDHAAQTTCDLQSARTTELPAGVPATPSTTASVNNGPNEDPYCARSSVACNINSEHHATLQQQNDSNLHPLADASQDTLTAQEEGAQQRKECKHEGVQHVGGTEVLQHFNAELPSRQPNPEAAHEAYLPALLHQVHFSHDSILISPCSRHKEEPNQNNSGQHTSHAHHTATTQRAPGHQADTNAIAKGSNKQEQSGTTTSESMHTMDGQHRSSSMAGVHTAPTAATSLTTQPAAATPATEQQCTSSEVLPADLLATTHTPESQPPAAIPKIEEFETGSTRGCQTPRIASLGLHAAAVKLTRVPPRCAGGKPRLDVVADDQDIVESTHRVFRSIQKAYRDVLHSDLYSVFVVDTETTGLSPTRDRIVELSIFSLSGGVMLSVDINPGHRHMSQEAQNVTGMTNHAAHEQHRPLFSEACDFILDFIASMCPSRTPLLVAHNAPFDMKFLAAELLRCDRNPPAEWMYLDTYRLGRTHKLNKKTADGKLKLGSLCKHYAAQVSCVPRHTARSDVLALSQVLPVLLLDMLGEDVSMDDTVERERCCGTMRSVREGMRGLWKPAVEAH